MRIVDPAIISQIVSGEIRSFICLYMAVGAGFRYTTCDVDLWAGGYRYTPRQFEPGTITYSTGKIVDQVTITMDNLDDALTADFVGSTVQGAEVIISTAWLDSNYALIGSPITLFEGTVGPWQLVDGSIEMTITNQFEQWNRRTFSQHSSSCRWKKFKGAQCGYAGAETACNRTYLRCKELGNEANFGGFPYLPSIERPPIWWGALSKAGGPWTWNSSKNTYVKR